MLIGEPLIYYNNIVIILFVLYWDKPIYIYFSCAAQHMLELDTNCMAKKVIFNLYKHTISYAIYIYTWLAYDSPFGLAFEMPSLCNGVDILGIIN